MLDELLKTHVTQLERQNAATSGKTQVIYDKMLEPQRRRQSSMSRESQTYIRQEEMQKQVRDAYLNEVKSGQRDTSFDRNKRIALRNNAVPMEIQQRQDNADNLGLKLNPLVPQGYMKPGDIQPAPQKPMYQRLWDKMLEPQQKRQSGFNKSSFDLDEFQKKAESYTGIPLDQVSKTVGPGSLKAATLRGKVTEGAGDVLSGMLSGARGVLKLVPTQLAPIREEK